MKNPVPASQYSPTCPSEDELLAQLPPGTTLCVMPNEGCEYVSALPLWAPCRPLCSRPPAKACHPCVNPLVLIHTAYLFSVHVPVTCMATRQAAWPPAMEWAAPTLSLLPLRHPHPTCFSLAVSRLQGTFDSSTCRCKCQNEEINAAGYCRDPTTGRCTTQKVRHGRFSCRMSFGASVGQLVGLQAALPNVRQDGCRWLRRAASLSRAVQPAASPAG